MSLRNVDKRVFLFFLPVYVIYASDMRQMLLMELMCSNDPYLNYLLTPPREATRKENNMNLVSSNLCMKCFYNKHSRVDIALTKCLGSTD